jgi:hypothetical protein
MIKSKLEKEYLLLKKKNEKKELIDEICGLQGEIEKIESKIDEVTKDLEIKARMVLKSGRRGSVKNDVDKFALNAFIKVNY